MIFILPSPPGFFWIGVYIPGFYDFPTIYLGFPGALPGGERSERSVAEGVYSIGPWPADIIRGSHDNNSVTNDKNMMHVRVTTQGWNGIYHNVDKKFYSQAHLQAYLRAINKSQFSKLIGVKNLTTTNSN